MKKREEVYDIFWYFAFERQNIWYRKMMGQRPPYTSDDILKEYKFCNAYRVLDRVSQYMLKNVIYNGENYSKEDMLFRIVLFKIFNKEDTWEYLTKKLGDITLSNFSFNKYDELLLIRKSLGEKLYNDAYISCANKAFGYDLKHQNHLALLDKMFIQDKIYNSISNAASMEEVFKILKSYPLIGDFMAYQLATDINYSDVTDFDESSFTIAGPGAKRGIDKCFKNHKGYSYEDIIIHMYLIQEEEFKRLGYDFKYIGKRRLQLIDIQNLFCETDKYLRAKRPDLKSNRVKIKKKYIPKSDKIEYVFPKIWNVKL